MACDFTKIFKILLPTGRAFQAFYNSTFYKFIDALAQEPERICDFYNDIRDAGIPGKIPLEALPYWEDDLAIPQNDTLTVVQRNDRIKGKLAAKGGQGPGYIEATLQAAGFPVYVYENNPISNPDVRAYTSTLNGFTLGSGATLGAYTDRIDPRTITGTLIAGPDIYIINKNYLATLGQFTLGEYDLGQYIGNTTTEYQYVIPAVPSQYIFVWFLAGPGGLNDFVDIPAAMFTDFKRLILEIKPAHTWVIAQVNQV
jgi:hypothetical protein